MSANGGRPNDGEFGAFHAGYVGKVQESDIVAAMTAQLTELLCTLKGVGSTEAGILDPPYTWTFREVVGHLTDAELIFGYRALRFIRGDQTPLPGFDENEFAKHGNYDATPLPEWLERFELARRSNLLLFSNLPTQIWLNTGFAADSKITVRAQAYIIVGHVRHHLDIVKGRLAGRSK